MKETKKSLKAYFLYVGVLGLVVKAIQIGCIEEEFNALFVIVSIVQISMSSLFIYYGIKMYDYLEKSPRTLVNFVVVAGALVGLVQLILGQFIYLIALVLLAFYLIHNIKKLSAQREN